MKFTVEVLFQIKLIRNLQQVNRVHDTYNKDELCRLFRREDSWQRIYTCRSHVFVRC